MPRNCLLKNKTSQPKASRAAPRMPSQTRGRERIDAILDAAAGLIVEKGMAGITMHALAARAQTSIGSLYHFFRDREAVIDALFERHTIAIRDIHEQLCNTADAVWSGLTPTQAIERLVIPYVNYLGHHGDYLPVMHHHAMPGKHTEFIRPLQHLLKARLPQCDETKRDEYATMLHLLAAGTMHAGLQFSAKHIDLYLREIPRMLATYLEDIESRVAADSTPPQPTRNLSPEKKRQGVRRPASS